MWTQRMQADLGGGGEEAGCPGGGACCRENDLVMCWGREGRECVQTLTDPVESSRGERRHNGRDQVAKKVEGRNA